MSQSSKPAPVNTGVNQRHAWIAVIIAFIAFVAAMGLALFLSVEGNLALANPPMLLFTTVAVAWGLGLVLMWRGQFERGVYLGLVVAMICYPLTSFWLADRGLNLGAGIGFAVVFVATLALPPARAQWFIVLGIFAALATIAIDVYGPENRLVAGSGVWGTLFIVGGIALAFAFFVALNFRNYPLRIKLLLAFVIISIISVGGVTWIATQAIRTALTENAANDLRTRAQSAALAVGITMDRNVDRLTTLSLNKSVQDQVSELSDSILEDANHDALVRENSARWASARPDETVIRDALNGQLAYSLRQFGDVFQGNENLFITDGTGSIIAATDWQPRYNFGQEDWWKAAYDTAKGSLYIGQPEYDPMINAFGVRTAIPIYAPGRERAVGVLHSVFTLTALQRVLLLNSFGETGKIDLLFPKGQILNSEGIFRELSPEEFSEIKDAIGLELPSLIYRGTPLLSSQAVVGVSDEQPEPYLRASAWRTIATIRPAELSSAVEAGTRAALFAGILAIAIAILSALLFAGFLTRPIQKLTMVAGEVQSGDLSARAPVESTDEIGVLAVSFNDMTERLQDTLTGLEQSVDARTQELLLANETLQSNAAYLSALSDTTSGLFERFNLNDLLSIIVERAGALVGTENGFVFFQSPGEENIEMRVGVGVYDDLIGTHAQRGVGLAGTVWQTGAPMVIDDYQKWEGRLPGSRRDALRAIIAVPLTRGAQGNLNPQGDTIGVIGLAHTDAARKFGKTELEILQRFAQLASIALDNARLYSSSEQRVQELGSLNSVSRIVAEETNLQALIDKVGDQVCQIYGTDFAYIALYDEASALIEFPYLMDGGKRTVQEPLPLGQGLTWQVIMSRQPLLLGTTSNEEFAQMGAIDSGDNQSPAALLSVPLLAGERVLGVLSVQRVGETHAFTSEDQRLLTTIASSFSVGIENARLAQATRRQVAELATLNKISALLNSNLPLPARLEEVGMQVREMFDVQNVYIALYDAVSNMIQMPFFYGDEKVYRIDSFLLGPGFTSHVIETRQVLLINDNLGARATEMHAPQVGEGELNESYLGAPILAGDRIMGVLGLSDAPRLRFKPSDIDLAVTIASAIGTAVQNSRLFDETQEALSKTSALYQVVREISTARDPQAVLQAMGQAIALPFVNRIILLEFEQDAEGELIAARVQGSWYSGQGTQPPPVGIEFGGAQFAMLRGFITPAPMLIENMETDPRLNETARTVGKQFGVTALASIPLLVGAQIVGALFLQSDQPHAWQEAEIEPVVSIASVLSVAVNNFRLLAESRAALDEMQRLAVRERESAEQVRALNRRLTREGWKNFLDLDASELMAEAYDGSADENGNGSAPQETESQVQRVQVPIVLRGETLGTIELDYDPTGGDWSSEQQEIVNDIGDKLGLVLDNARLYGQMQAALDQTQRLAEREKKAAEIANRIYAATDVNVLLRIATEELRRTTGSARAVVKLSRDKNSS